MVVAGGPAARLSNASVFYIHVIKENDMLVVRSDLFCGYKRSDFINNIPILTE
jgi:hypothetical protein